MSKKKKKRQSEVIDRLRACREVAVHHDVMIIARVCQD
jgi:hypothetical protein